MDYGGVTATQVGLLIAVETLVAMACYVPVAHLADRYGKEPFVIATFLFFTAFPLTLLAAHRFETLLLAFVVRGLKEFGDSPRKALIIEYSAAESRGRSIGAYYLIRDVIVSAGAAGSRLMEVRPRSEFSRRRRAGSARNDSLRRPHIPAIKSSMPTQNRAINFSTHSVPEPARRLLLPLGHYTKPSRDSHGAVPANVNP